MNSTLVNSLCYTVGWFWCVLFGINGRSLWALAGAVCLIIFQLYVVKMKNIRLYIEDFLLAAFSIPLGFFLEILFIQAGLILYVNTENTIPPIWVVCLYPLFSLQLNHALKAIKKNYLISFVFGFLGAPLSYIAGVSLGGVTFPYSLFQTYVWVGICWGLFLCFLVKIANLIDQAAAETLADWDSKDEVKLLYDGECPICKREVCFLRKKDNEAKIEFIDISSKEFLQLGYNIDYKTAMSEIHAIDAKGNLIVGIPAFAAIYARCQMLVISTLMRIPAIEWICRLFYKIFAKNRLWLTGRKDDNK